MKLEKLSYYWIYTILVRYFFLNSPKKMYSFPIILRALQKVFMKKRVFLITLHRLLLQKATIQNQTT